MTPSADNKHSLRPSRNAVLFLGFVVAVIYMGVMTYTYIQHNKGRATQAQIVTFHGLKNISGFKAVLKNHTGTNELELKDDAIFLPPQIVETFSLPYELSASWLEKDQSYRDIKWAVDKRGVDYTVILDGFDPDDTVSISFDGDYPFKDYSFDWSGKIEIPALIQADKDFKICVDIQSKNSFSFCHRVVGKKGGSA